MNVPIELLSAAAMVVVLHLRLRLHHTRSFLVLLVHLESGPPQQVCACHCWCW